MKILNTLQHELTTDQLAELTALGYTEVIHLRNLNPELFAGMANSPASEIGVEEMAIQLLNTISSEDPDGWRSPSFNIGAVLFPLGSPATMFAFARKVGEATRPWGPENMESSFPVFLFAHSERVAEDQPQLDGTVRKVQVFKHLRFLKF